MESGAWEQGTGSWLRGNRCGDRRESRGRGLSVHLHNDNALHAICSIYYLNLSQISFKHSISKNEPSSTNVKRSATASSLGLCVFFFSHPQCIRSALPLNGPCRAPVRYPCSLSWSYLSLVSGTTVQTKSSRTKKENFTLPNNFWRSCETKQDQYFGVKKQNLGSNWFWPVISDSEALCVYHFGFGRGSQLAVSDFLRPHVLCSPWNFPGYSTGVVSLPHFQDLPNPEIEPGSPALLANYLLCEPRVFFFFFYPNSQLLLWIQWQSTFIVALFIQVRFLCS